jgi:hypothetical protein
MIGTTHKNRCGVANPMITDIIDLEQVLAQYDSEIILVGPLLSLAISSYQYFHLAGNGSKIYCSIGLGFPENESRAQKQRADIIEKLRPRFTELLLFDSQTELTRAVHARWRTEETAQALASTEREAKAASVPQADDEAIKEREQERTLRDEQTEWRPDLQLLPQHQNASPLREVCPTGVAPVASEGQRPFWINQAGQGPVEALHQESLKSRSYQNGLASNDQFHEFVGPHLDEVFAKPDKPDGLTRVDVTAELLGSAVNLEHEPNNVAGRDRANLGEIPTGHHRQTGSLTRELFEQTLRDEGASIRLPPAATLPPLTKEYDAIRARPQSRNHGLAEDDFASAILKLASPAQLDSDPIPAVDPGSSPPVSSAVVAVEPVPIHPESASITPVKPTRSKLTVRWLATTAAATVLFSVLVEPNTQQNVEQADNAFPAGITSVPSKSAAAVPTLAVRQRADANQSGRPKQSALGAAFPPSVAAAAPSRPGGAGAAPVSEKHEAITQQARIADLPESKETAKQVSRSMEPPKGGDLKSARLSLPPRAVEAKSGAAGETTQVEPSQTIPQLNINQPLAVKKLGPQTVQPPPIKPSSDVGQPSQAAMLESGRTPGSVQTAPGQEGSTIRHLDPDEIAVLLSQGMDFFKSGDFASARLSLRRAAEAGNADAALELGSTYDPLVLRQLGAIGIAADIAQARRWYQKAIDLGSAAAIQRLATLAQTAR